MDQNQFFGYYGQPGLWNGQTVNVDTRSFCQTLTEEEMKSLEQAQEEFTLGISKEEQLRAICMHRDINGHNMLDADKITGQAKCKICGETFKIVDRCSDQDIADAVANLIDILQTTKTLYVDMPSDAAKKFYTILALLKKVPGLYKIAVENFAKHENAISNWRFGQNSAVNEYNMLYQGFNPAMPNPYAQPMYYQQPVMGAPVPPANAGNPFGFNGQSVAPQPYAPMMQGYQYTPAAPVAPVAPVAAPAAPVENPPAETVSVDTAFKA